MIPKPRKISTSTEELGHIGRCEMRCPFCDWEYRGSEFRLKRRIKSLLGHLDIYHLSFLFHPWSETKIFFKRSRRICRWIPLLWRIGTWDWTHIFAVLAHQLQAMSTDIAKYGSHIDSDRTARQLFRAAATCRRIARDDYIMMKPPLGPLSSDKMDLKWRYDDYFYRQDVAYLMKLITRHGRGWWD